MAELWKTPRVVPSLIYNDVPSAVDFLTRAFGFRERAESRLTGKGFCIAWMEVGEGQLSLNTPNSGNESPETVGKSTQTVKIYVDNLDRHFEQAKSAGAKILSGIEEGFWGGRFYRAEDPEGHRWEFSQVGRELASHLWKVPPGIKLGA